MLSGITVFCFFASYCVAFALEVSRLFFRMPVRLVVMLGFAGAGILAQVLYLLNRSLGGELPLSSWHDWFLIAALVLACIYPFLAIMRPQASIGLFLLPMVLVLVGVAWTLPASAVFPPKQAQYMWAMAHGIMLLLGTVAVSLGFVAGVMYLVQSWRLKHHVSPQAGLKLPSLEWLQAINKQSLIFSSFFIALGLVAGIILNSIKAREHLGGLPWTDSVVISSAVLLVWLLIATAFEWLYKPAQQGRKVAYLTVASFVFLAFVMAMLVAGGSRHAQAAVGGKGSGFRVQGSGHEVQGIRQDTARRLAVSTSYSVLSTLYPVQRALHIDRPINRSQITDFRYSAPEAAP